MRVAVPLFLLIQLVLHLANASVRADCFSEGECLRSMFVDSAVTDSREECYQQCLANDLCRFFTYYANDKECLQFANCIEFSNTSCSNCFTGEKTCSLYECHRKGQCQGIYVDEVHAETQNDCLAKCKTQKDCSWYSYDDGEYLCTLLESCDNVDATCTSCMNGQVECEKEKESTKLLVVTGANPTAEAVDLESLDTNCRNPANYPVNFLYAGVGLTFNDQPMICGGAPSTNECYKYDQVFDKWDRQNPLQESRYRATAVKLRYNEYWIMGGQSAEGLPMRTTEIFKDGAFRNGPSMPEPMYGHCVVRINSTHVFVASGVTMNVATNATSLSDNTYLINLETFEWNILDPLVEPRWCAACGFVKTASGEIEVIVAGGYNQSTVDTVDILSLTDLEWREGPSYPSPMSCMGTVQFEDSFLSTGGHNGQFLSNTIYQFSDDDDWVLKGRTLQYPRDAHIAFAVEDNFATCSKNRGSD